jgi:hypothetical protein
MSFAGKSLLTEACIVRDSQAIVADQDSGTKHCQIICVWQKGADALIEQYRQLEGRLPKADNLEVMVVTKEELMRKFRVGGVPVEFRWSSGSVETTYQINSLCYNISQRLKDKEVHLYIDECWITVPKKYNAHLTQVCVFPPLNNNIVTL